MYKNPLNNGDLSDYNSLKNQQDNGKIIKKYQSRKLKTEPTELQKYYQYLTYQQSILDELNYVAQRMKDENIQKQKEDFNFIEDLKLRREKTMQEEAKMESTIKEMRESLFNYPSVEIEKDITPTIITDNELEMQIKASNLLKASIKRAEIQPIYREGAEYQRELATQAEIEKKDLPYKKEIQRRIREIDPKASISGTKNKLMEKLQQLEKERKIPKPQIEPRKTYELLAETEKKKAKKQKKIF